MKVQFENFGFYKVDKNYLRFLHSKDRQVFYKDEEGYHKKPHLGLVVQLGAMKYCIPLTSAKTRQLNWANVSKHNLIVYEIVKKSELCSNDIYKNISNTDTYKKILAVLEIRKMVPINDKLCTYINFDDVEDSSYKNLLEKEYRFLKPHKQTI